MESLDQLVYVCQTDPSHMVRAKAKEAMLSFGMQNNILRYCFYIISKWIRSIDQYGNLLNILSQLKNVFKLAILTIKMVIVVISLR